MINKIVNDLCSDSLKERLATRSQISNYSTRNYLHLDSPRQNLEFSKRNFFYCGAQTSNDYFVQKEIKGIAAQLASFPKAQSLGRPAISTNINSSLVKKFRLLFFVFILIS